MNDNIIKILITAKDEASSVLNGIKQQAQETADASKKFAVGLAAAATAAAGFLGYGAKIAGDLEASRAGFITLLGSAEKADEALAMIKKDAASTPFELPGLISANQLLTSVTKDAVQSESILMNVGKALTAMGKGQPELDRIIVNLQQIGAVGKASLMDVRQFAFAGIPIFEMLTQATGKTGEELSTFISEGGVTFEILEKMFNDAGMAGGRFADAFANQAGGFNQVLANLKDNVTIAMADIVTKSGAFDVIKNAMKGVSDWITSNKDAIAAGLTNAFAWIKDNGVVIAGVLIGALVPALISTAAGVWAVIAPLIPFMAVGAAIALIITKVADSMGGWDNLLKAVQPTLSTIASVVKNVVVTAFEALVKVWEFLKPSLMALWDTISQQLIPALMRLWNFIAPVLIPILKTVGIIIGVVIVGAIWLLVNAFNIAFQVISFLINGFINIWNGIVTGITWVVNLIQTVLVTAFNILSAIVTPIINGIVGVFTFFFNVVTGYINILLAVWGYVFAVIRGIVTIVFTAIWGVVKPVFDKIGQAINFVGGVIGNIFNGVKNTIIGVFTAVWNFISPIINNIKTAFSNAINGVVGFFSGLWGRISGFVTTAVNNVKNFFSGMFSGIGDGFKTAVNWIIDGINGFIGTLNDTVGKIPGVPQISKLSRLYTGGQVTSGGMAIVGDAGPEAVFLPAGAQVVSNRNTQAMLANGGGPGGGSNVKIEVNYNGRGQFSQTDAVDMAKQIRDALRAQGLDMTQIGALRT